MVDEFDKITRQITEEAFAKIAKGLLDEALKQPWDGPTWLYLVIGDQDLPHYLPFASAMAHPVALMRAVFADGIRVPSEAIGVAVMTEAYRHVTWDEMPERMRNGMLNGLETLLADENLSDEDLLRAAQEGYYKAMRRFSLHDLPDEARREIRSVVVVMRDGTVGQGSHTRGMDDFNSYYMARTTDDPDEVRIEGRVPQALNDFLNGRPPADDKEHS